MSPFTIRQHPTNTRQQRRASETEGTLVSSLHFDLAFVPDHIVPRTAAFQDSIPRLARRPQQLQRQLPVVRAHRSANSPANSSASSKPLRHLRTSGVLPLAVNVVVVTIARSRNRIRLRLRTIAPGNCFARPVTAATTTAEPNLEESPRPTRTAQTDDCDLFFYASPRPQLAHEQPTTFSPGALTLATLQNFLPRNSLIRP
jgi:hypothetical protein